MLIEFRVKNFASFQEEQVLSLVATKDKTYQDNNTFSPPAQNPMQLLKGVVIYGANASGKTNLIRAMEVMRRIVLMGLTKSMEEQFPIIPFLLGEQNDIIEFEISFYVEEKRYCYGFSLTQIQIIQEYLFVYETNRRQKWFKREWRGEEYVWEYGPKLSGNKKVWQESTRKDALFLTTAVQLNNQQFLPIKQWFQNFKITDNMWSDSFKLSIDKSKTKQKEMIEMLKCADLDIQDFQIKEEDFDLQTLPNHLPNFLKEMTIKEKLEGTKMKVLFSHTTQDGKEEFFDIGQESSGTQKLFKLLGPWIDALENGCIVVIDELNNHLHPYMTKFLVEMFFNPNINTKNAQLIFTTHETSILNQKLFRRDQVWFCEKYNKATQLYPLTDFKPRKESNLEDAYLSGRFGALPFLSNIAKVFENQDEK